MCAPRRAIARNLSRTGVAPGGSPADGFSPGSIERRVLPMKLYVFGSSLTSSYWNGAATYYRGIYQNLDSLGYDITFAEPDIYSRQQHRDCPSIAYADVRVYQTPRDLDAVLREAQAADLIIKHSGVGADDELLEAEVLDCRRPDARVAFWDVDAPATLAKVEANPG